MDFLLCAPSLGPTAPSAGTDLTTAPLSSRLNPAGTSIKIERARCLQSGPDQQKSTTLVEANGRASDDGESSHGLCALLPSTSAVTQSLMTDGTESPSRLPGSPEYVPQYSVVHTRSSCSAIGKNLRPRFLYMEVAGQYHQQGYGSKHQGTKGAWP